MKEKLFKVVLERAIINFGKTILSHMTVEVKAIDEWEATKRAKKQLKDKRWLMLSCTPVKESRT